jgi:hypothetical protein
MAYVAPQILQNPPPFAVQMCTQASTRETGIERSKLLSQSFLSTLSPGDLQFAPSYLHHRRHHRQSSPFGATVLMGRFCRTALSGARVLGFRNRNILHSKVNPTLSPLIRWFSYTPRERVSLRRLPMLGGLWWGHYNPTAHNIVIIIIVILLSTPRRSYLSFWSRIILYSFFRKEIWNEFNRKQLSVRFILTQKCQSHTSFNVNSVLENLYGWVLKTNAIAP